MGLKRPRQAKPSPPPVPAVVSNAVVSNKIWRRHVFPLLTLGVFLLLAYSNSFRAGFLFDSGAIILGDTRVHAVTPENLKLIANQGYWYHTANEILYRPLTTLSYLFNYAILRNADRPPGYHWTNLTLHALNTLLVYLLALAVLGEMSRALAVASIWTLHPVLTESVTNIVGRADLLSATGTLAGTLCYLRAGNAEGWRKGAWLVGLAAAAAVAISSKESGVVLMAVMLLYDLSAIETKWRSALTGYAAAAIPCCLFLLVRAQVIATLPAPDVPYLENPLFQVSSPWQLTAFKVIGEYLLLFVWPARISADYSYNQIPISRGIGDWPALLSLTVCVAGVLMAVYSVRRRRPAFFFIGFFFAALAPVSNLALRIGTIMAERFLYLPSVGLAGCAVYAACSATDRFAIRWPPLRPAMVSLLVLVCTALAIRTHARNADWQNERTLWESAAAVSPNSYKPHMQLSIFLRGENGPGPDRSLAEADRMVAILDPLPPERSAPFPYINAGSTYRLKGDLVAKQAGQAAAEPYYRRALEILLRGRQVELARNRFKRAEAQSRGESPRDFGFDTLYLELAQTYLRLSQPQEALDALHYGRRLNAIPDFFEYLSEAYRAMGQPSEAAISLLEGLVSDPRQKVFASQLVNLYRDTEPRSCAVQGANVNLECPLVHDQLCTAIRNVIQMHMEAGNTAAAALVGRTAQGLACHAR